MFDVTPHMDSLTKHSLLILNNIQTREDLRSFMEQHVYCVWDFMSLLKRLQHVIAPSMEVWTPNRNHSPRSVRLINEIVLAEESDVDQYGNPMSHLDLYLSAMREVGADTYPVLTFIQDVRTRGIDAALMGDIPAHVRDFMTVTFSFNTPHEVAAAFLYGREAVIPQMFRQLLQQLKISQQSAPTFYHYLVRHIELDEGDHAPAGKAILAELAGHDPLKVVEMERAAIRAINARKAFWDAVEESLS